MLKFKDIADDPEDDRIQQIGEAVMRDRGTVGFITDVEGPDCFAKADRYVTKLKARFPGIRVISKAVGPVEGTVFVKVGPPVQ